MGAFTSVKRWIMNLFNMSEEYKPVASIDSGYYDEYIDVWKKIYQGYYPDFHRVKYTTPEGQGQRDLASMRVAKIICSEMAGLLFTEKIQIKITDKAINDYVHKVFKDSKFMTNQKQLIEYGYAMGGYANTVSRKNDKTIISYVKADDFYPIDWSESGITGAAFVHTSYTKDFIYYLVSERKFENNRSIVEYKLFKEKVTSRGGKAVQVSLDEKYPELTNPIIIENASRASFSYFKPNVANNIDMNTPLGVSLFANALDTIKSLDIAFDSFQREFVLGKKRIIVPSRALKTITDPVTKATHRYFDSTVDVYEGINVGQDENATFKDDTQTLRIDEHIAAINAYLNILCIQIGMTPGFISFDSKDGLKTATEVVSENSKTYRTKTSQDEAIRQNLEEIIDIIIDIGVVYGEIPQPSEDMEVNIKFDDSIIEDKVAERIRDQLEVGQGLMSKVEFRVKWYGEDEKEATKKVKQIQSQSMGPEFNGPSEGGDA